VDINLLREAVLVLAFGAFAGVVWWAYGPSRRSRFEQVGASVLHDEDHVEAAPARHGTELRAE
jgi:cbb3-type cytochrome oxidase subunit 3